MLLSSKSPILLRFSKSCLNTLSKKLKHDLPTPLPQPPKKQPFYRRWFEYFIVYTMPAATHAFHDIAIADARHFDKLDEKTWDLIYNDFDASRIAFICVLAGAAVVVALVAVSIEYFINEEVTFTFARRLKKDAKELGYFMVVPLSLLVFVVVTLWRLHVIRVLRIYQNNSDPNSYIMIRSGILKFLKKTPFKRSEFKSSPSFYNKDANYFHQMANGNITVSNKAAHLNIEAFQEPIFKAYLFGERNTLPGKMMDPSPSEFPHPSSSKLKKPPVPPPM